jgi:hypothetical protein
MDSLRELGRRLVDEAPVAPTPIAELTRRGRRRVMRNRGFAVVAAVAVAIGASVAGVALSGASPTRVQVLGQGPSPSVPSTGERPAPRVEQRCPSSFVLPFVPTYLPLGWRPVSQHVAHANVGTDAIEVWSGTNTGASLYGVIEVWRGTDVPKPSLTGSETITVLGRSARLGPISDGWSVTFRTAQSASPCDQWALVGHPGVTDQILATVAEHLRPVYSG